MHGAVLRLGRTHRRGRQLGPIWIQQGVPGAFPPTFTLDPILALKRLLQNPNFGSKSWVYQQYDHMVMADTIRRPGKGAGIVRIHKTSKALAFTSHVNPRYCQADPFEGGKQAVAEAYRNLISVGAKPLAATDNLNFGNPEKPEIMGQFVNCIRGISEACKYLNVPIVSGNVSLYNETDGEPKQTGHGTTKNQGEILACAHRFPCSKLLMHLFVSSIIFTR